MGVILLVFVLGGGFVWFFITVRVLGGGGFGGCGSGLVAVLGGVSIWGWLLGLYYVPVLWLFGGGSCVGFGGVGGFSLRGLEGGLWFFIKFCVNIVGFLFLICF